MTASTEALVPLGSGRSFASSRLVRLGDVLPSGEARLDALARYLQDIAADDGRDASIDHHTAWLVRKTLLVLRRRPRLEEALDLVTWASGSGARWAERRTTIAVAGDAIVEVASLWVCVDLATMRPARLSERFWTMYGGAVGDRTVSSRLVHPDPPGAPRNERPWPLRVSDLDMLGHVNNAATWEAVEDELDRVSPGSRLVRAELEYRVPIDTSHRISLVSDVKGSDVKGSDVLDHRDASGQSIRVWLVAEGSVLASAAVAVTRD
jgi:acyl-ACP thioesterase